MDPVSRAKSSESRDLGWGRASLQMERALIPPLSQNRHQLRVLPHKTNHKWCLAVTISSLRISTRLQQHSNGITLPTSHRDVQWNPPRTSRLVRFSSRLQQQRYYFRNFTHQRPVQPRPALEVDLVNIVNLSKARLHLINRRAIAHQVRKCRIGPIIRHDYPLSPSPWGEGWDEGETVESK